MAGQSLIKDKIILRSAVAFIPTVVWYSIGYGIASASGAISIPYFDPLAWIAIAAVCVVWPINRLPLMMLFEPIEYLCNRGLLKNESRAPEKNPILKGNF